MKTYLFLAALAAFPFAMSAQDTRTVKEVFATPASRGSDHIRVTIHEEKQCVDIDVDGKPFTTYHWASEFRRPSLYPILSPRQNFITRGYPLDPRPNERIDHPNQVGMWFAYSHVNGIDFWNSPGSSSPASTGVYGTIRHKAIKKAESGKHSGNLETESEWVSPSGKVLVKETTEYEFEGGGTSRVITRTTHLQAKEDLLFTDNRDGLLAIRLARGLEHDYEEDLILTDSAGRPGKEPSRGGTPIGEFVSSEDIKSDSTHSKRAEWMMLKGRIEGEPLTLAVYDHPKNPGFPNCWNTRGYGLFAANPLGQSIFSRGIEELGLRVAKGKTVTFKHQIRVNSGYPLRPDECEKLWVEFSSDKKDKEVEP